MLRPPSKVLVTGFDPFGDADVNPSWLVARALHGRQIARHRIVAAQLPTVFGQSAQQLSALLKLHRPALVLCLGLAAGRAAISLERVAINVDDARIPDNRGAQPIDSPVVQAGPSAYFARMPVKAMLQAIRAAGIPAELSNTAGTFVCNHVFYALMHLLATRRDHKGTRGGFIHLPCLPEHALAHGAPASMAQHDMERGLRAAIRAALEHTGAQDVGLAAGTTH
jgi:pyroglutamyl-peptidase